jgi:competence CoiA-like predicted nuclease
VHFSSSTSNRILVPLKAIVDKEIIIGPDLSEKEWADLKLRHKKGLPVTMSCCGAPGHLRVSGNGTQHFYHAVDTGCHYAEESREHLEIKYQIYRTCKSEQWESYVEFPASDRTWISDVYATRDGRKIVFEVQISTISLGDLEERDRKYRAEGIESYWLLDNFLNRSKAFASWYDAHLFGEDDEPGETTPYIDHSLFETGPENHIFIPKGIRSAGLDAKNQTLFTTNNPAIPLALWVREVLKGNYRRYLEETAAAYHRKRRLMTLAAPALIRFRDFYQKIIRRKTYREKAGHYGRMSKTGTRENDRALQKKVQHLYAEIDWLENEYRSSVSESYGLFTWKKIPGSNTPGLYFRLESESNVKKLLECVEMFARWEESFERAIGNPGRETQPGKNSTDR